MASPIMKTYRIPTDPVGMAYYRQGQRYEPGQKVLLPADELPPGWKTVNGKPKPVERHAWKLLEPGKKEKSDEATTALENARAQAEELAKQLAEQQRVLQELEAAEGDQGAPKRGVVEEGDEGPEPEPKDPDAEDLDEVDEEEEADDADETADPEVADVTKPPRGAKKGKRGAKGKGAKPAKAAAAGEPGRTKDEEL